MQLHTRPHYLSKLLTLCLLSMMALATRANEQIYTDFDEYRVQHTVFNSTFLQPEVASTYGLVRGEGRLLVNIALLRKQNKGPGYSLGLPVQISGQVKNLMQQSKRLSFQEIKENDATYYLAELRMDSKEEVLHFDIELRYGERRFDLKFDKKLYDE